MYVEFATSPSSATTSLRACASAASATPNALRVATPSSPYVGRSSCPRVGCVQETELVGSVALTSEPGPIAVFADKVYFATTGTTKKIYACAVAGCGGTPEVISDALGETTVEVEQARFGGAIEDSAFAPAKPAAQP